MATHSNILAWRIPWPEEPGGLQSIALQRVGHGTNEHAHCSSKVLQGLFLKVHGKKKSSRDQRAWPQHASPSLSPNPEMTKKTPLPPRGGRRTQSIAIQPQPKLPAQKALLEPKAWEAWETERE